MKSIRTKTTIPNVVAVTISMGIATTIGGISIAHNGHEEAERKQPNINNSKNPREISRIFHINYRINSSYF